MVRIITAPSVNNVSFGILPLRDVGKQTVFMEVTAN